MAWPGGRSWDGGTSFPGKCEDEVAWSYWALRRWNTLLSNSTDAKRSSMGEYHLKGEWNLW